MGQPNAQVEVKNNQAKSCYEANVDGQLAVLTYERDGDTITYLHTETPASLEGRGVGSALARAALDEARSQQLTIVPQCPFVAAYIRRHPQYLDLVEESQRANFSDSGK